MTVQSLSQPGSVRVAELIKFFDLILPTSGHRILQAKRGSKFLTPQFYSTNADFARRSYRQTRLGLRCMTRLRAIATRFQIRQKVIRGTVSWDVAGPMLLC